ncbi:corrinoid protein [Carboxylicivirga sediminis]|uniref:Corrinoid protein n=1 Tax=Carboxylicivirga sediminis TaxID=2006564 RepID=A0A941IZH7_9BACT|nr:corrinoid protein [Carboxylicivirga sediminis]MBR8536682.1 corrinoid protein [Carboxylicivirga sediminis]
MEELFSKLADCIEFGKIDEVSPYPPNFKGQTGADEITAQVLAKGASAQDVLNNALIPGMEKVGVKFREGTIFVPQVLMSAKAMKTAMVHLKPLLKQGNVKQKGTFVIGTVEGDLHDIGKNLVAMMVEGNGYEVIDMGTDVSVDAFVQQIEKTPDCVVGLSALLTTTMVNMEKIVKNVKEKFPHQKVCIGGAPVNNEFCDKIGADNYSADPQGVVDFLNTLAS